MPAIAQSVGNAAQGVEDNQQAAQDQRAPAGRAVGRQCEQDGGDPAAVIGRKHPQHLGLEGDGGRAALCSHEVVDVEEQLEAHEEHGPDGCGQPEQGGLARMPGRQRMRGGKRRLN